MFNLNTLDVQEIRALARMLEPGNDKVLKIIGSLLDETKAALVSADETARIHRLQGRAQALQGFLDAVEAARKVESR
jgi:hypothetical protein